MDGVASYISVMAILILMSAYFSATETAFSSLNKTRVKTMAEKGNKRAELVLKLSERYDNLISTILIGNNIVNIALASIGTVMFVHLYGDMGATISTAVVTVVVLIFGEITPKSIAKDMPEKFASFSAPIIDVLIVLFTPLNFLFTQWKKLVSMIFKVEEDKKMSNEELLMFVDEVEQEGSIDTDSGDLLRNAIEFKDRKAEDILTHRVDLEAVSIDTDKDEIARMFSETKFSRLLVYEEDIDNIIGIINQKDFYINGKVTSQQITDIITKPLFIHQSEKIDRLLKMLQKEKSHIAVVIDEYGGTLGIVTMEDILEELVGEIWDEHDEIVEMFHEINPNLYKVDCSVNNEDFCAFFDVEYETESTSLSGWIMEQLEKMPEEGDSFTFENLTIRIDSIDGHRVDYVIVSVKEEAIEEDEDKRSEKI